MKKMMLITIALLALASPAFAQSACPVPGSVVNGAVTPNTVVTFGINSTLLAAQGVPPANICNGVTDADALALIDTYAESCPATVNNATAPATVTPCTTQQIVAWIGQSIVSGVLINVTKHVADKAAAREVAASAPPTVTTLTPQ
jgi:hypothetical protein